MSPNDNLFALGNKFIMEQGVYEPVGRFEQRTSSLLVGEYTTNEDPTLMEYPQNMLWLGERSAAYIDCYACVRFNNTIKCRLIKTFFFESFAANSGDLWTHGPAYRRCTGKLSNVASDRG
jgi:hypothetical protein